MKYKIKEGTGDSKVNYKAPDRVSMTSIILKNATQAQLKELAAIGYPFVEEVKQIKAEVAEAKKK